MKRVLFLITTLCIALFQSNAQDKLNTCYRLPYASAVVKSVKKTNPNNRHPRLMVNAERFAEIKESAQNDKICAGWYSDIMKRADNLVKGGAPKAISRGGLMGNMQDLGFAYNITKETKYAERAWSELELYLKAETWEVSGFLDVGSISKGIAVGYDWLYNAFTPEQRARIEAKCKVEVWDKAMFAYQNTHINSPYNNQKLSGWDNWNPTCNGGVIMTALAMCDVDQYSDICGEVIVRGMYFWQNYMKEFYPDGACIEGVAYWYWGVKSMIEGIESLRYAAGDTYGYEEAMGFSSTPYYPIYLIGPTHQIFNFGNATITDRRIITEFYWFAEQFNDPILNSIRLNEMQRRGERGTVYDLMWYNGKRVGDEVNPYKELPLNRRFRTAEIVSLRSSWEDDALYVSMKGGDNFATHGHLNAGTFILEAYGERWITQFGCEDYAVPGYFDRGRMDSQGYDYYRVRAEGQNTLIMNPSELADQIPWAMCRISSFDAERATATIDMTEAFDPYVHSASRSVALVDGREVRITDLIKCKEETTIWSFMHTDADITLTNGGKGAILIKGDKQLEVKLNVKGAKGVFTVRESVQLPTSPKRHPMERSNEGTRKLAIELNDAKDVEIEVTFK